MQIAHFCVEHLLSPCNKCKSNCPNPNGLQENNFWEAHSYYMSLLWQDRWWCTLTKSSPHTKTQRDAKNMWNQNRMWVGLTRFSKSISSFSFPMRSSLSWWAFSNLMFSWRSLASSWKPCMTFELFQLPLGQETALCGFQVYESWLLVTHYYFVNLHCSNRTINPKK